MKPGPRKNFAASVRQRLLDLSRQRGEDFQFILSRYTAERLLYRLGVSAHRERFVLKGALLFVLWKGQPHRATRDLDLLGFGDSDSTGLVVAFSDVCGTAVEDDGLVFLAETVAGANIREDQEYGGVRLNFVAMLERARIPMQVDIGFGDAITPDAIWCDYPTLLDAPPPHLRAYPRETVVAEKLEAIVSLGMANSRMKDFYDLIVLAHEFEFGGAQLAAAIRATFHRRQTGLPTERPLGLSEDFAVDTSKRTQWSAFRRRQFITDAPAELTDAVTLVRAFVEPVLMAAAAEKEYLSN
ncbi:MAG: nucleotidyl transferase AbiEii/AbiGii toxin family protein, partial [Chthoniobacteraceae bacterium]